MFANPHARDYEFLAWQKECRFAYWCRVFSDAESGTVRQVLYLDLAAHAESQAWLWRQEARKSGVTLPGSWMPGLADMAVFGLLQILGPRWTGWLLWLSGHAGFSLYGRFHRQGVSRILSGGMDGLVSNACLIFGVAGVVQERPLLATAGLLGLLFGAGLAGLGDWLAMARRLRRLGRTGVPAEHLRGGEEAGLPVLLEKRGLSHASAGRILHSLHADPDRTLRYLPLAVKGMGVGEHDPPQGAALVGLISFAAGALIPLAGLFVAAAEWAVPMAAGISALALGGMAAGRATLLGKPAWRGGVGALVLAGGAALAAWGLGWSLGRLVP